MDEGSFLETVGQTPRYEFAWGTVERLPMVNLRTSDVVEYLFEAIKAFCAAASAGQGEVLTAPHPLAARPLPRTDIVYLSATRVVKRREYPEGADLVVRDREWERPDRRRDTVDKRADYALGGIPEYWIVDPDERTITVLALEGAAYREAGIYHPGDKAASVLLDGLLVDVAACFAAGMGRPSERSRPNDARHRWRSRPFRKIVRGKARESLRKYLSQGEMLGRQGRNVVSIPVPRIDIPHFRHGKKGSGGTGQGTARSVSRSVPRAIRRTVRSEAREANRGASTSAKSSLTRRTRHHAWRGAGVTAY